LTSKSLICFPLKGEKLPDCCGLLAEAKLLSINISQAAEAGVARAVAEKRAELWLVANEEALKSSNAYAELHGLPLAAYRQFRLQIAAALDCLFQRV
jgi:antitoxin CcdA